MDTATHAFCPWFAYEQIVSTIGSCRHAEVQPCFETGHGSKSGGTDMLHRQARVGPAHTFWVFS